MIGIAGIRHAPVDIVVDTHSIRRAFALVSVAETLTTHGGAATVVIADQIITTVSRISARTHPSDLRNLCTRRTR